MPREPQRCRDCSQSSSEKETNAGTSLSGIVPLWCMKALCAIRNYDDTRKHANVLVSRRHCKYNNWVRPTIYQGMYNAIQRAIEPELIPVCRRYGIDIVVYNPIAGGVLSGKYKTNEVPAEGRYSNTNETVGKSYRARYFQDATFDALRLIEPVVEKHNLTLLEVAFRWLIHHSKLNIKGKKIEAWRHRAFLESTYCLSEV